jgi:glycosyltransferase involved in cell wall biosynthesis
MPSPDTRRPTVSVGMPVYNGERYLEEALQSILTQTFEDFELIISDNASTDRTGEICRAYAEKDDRIRYFSMVLKVGGGRRYLRSRLSTASRRGPRP